MMRGTGSNRSQKEEECDDKKQPTLNSVICEPKIIFHRHFPHDIIFEIFCRATIESLDACTRVSKGWIDLITDPSLIEFYQKKNNIGGHYSRKEWLDFISYHGFIQGKRNKKEFAGYFWQNTIPDLDSEYCHCHSIFVPNDEKNCDPSIRKWRIPEEMEILAACKQEGILFCRDRNNHFVGMPAVAKWTIIPEPNDVNDYQYMYNFNYIPHIEDFAFGMVVLASNPLWYKVVKLVRTWGRFYYHIYDSKIRGWRKVAVAECSDKPMLSFYWPSVSVSGSIYWQTYDTHVLAFNGFEDSFHHLRYGLTTDFYHQDVMIHEFNGQLGLSIVTEGETELWEIYEIDKK